MTRTTAGGTSSSTRTGLAGGIARPAQGRRRPPHLRLREPARPVPCPPAIDETRLAEFDEARVPVVTPDGPGVLVRENSGWAVGVLAQVRRREHPQDRREYDHRRAR
ncbi:DUF6210 family protein [Streptomyces sp. NPDC005728]|uniref:DUF6210 family protein n=1 Tax=Streptomyces sp. NPDC005728 TaxID=3157054 RepID=UPI00340CBE59